MTSEIQGVGWITIQDGKLEEFKRITAESTDVVRTKDTGTLQYDIYISNDQSEAVVLERYRDADALLEHAANLGELGPAVFATGSARSALIGELPEDLKAKLAGGPVRLFTCFSSM